MAEETNRNNGENNGETGDRAAARGDEDGAFTLSELERMSTPSSVTMADLSTTHDASEEQARAQNAASAARAPQSGRSARSVRPARQGQAQARASQGRVSSPVSRLAAASNASSSAAERGDRVARGSERAQQARPVRQPSAPSAQAQPRRRGTRVPRARRMKLSVTKVSPWSVAKVSFMLSIAGGIIQTICVAILYGIISAAGVFDKISSLVSQTGLANHFNISSVLGFGQVLSAVVIFSVFEVVIIVLISVIFAFLYNVVSALVGGVHVTLGDD